MGPPRARSPHPRRAEYADAGAEPCDPGDVLSSLRDRRGNPNWAVRVLALVVALLVAGPAIALAVLRGLESLFSVL